MFLFWGRYDSNYVTVLARGLFDVLPSLEKLTLKRNRITAFDAVIDGDMQNFLEEHRHLRLHTISL